MYDNDDRVVLTLDAGGTNFIFSAIQYGRSIVEPIRLPSNCHDLQSCLDTLVDGFTRVRERLDTPAAAISFAFPGPADYRNGVIGELPNLPAFRQGGVALGPYLEEAFSLPVFINNDGALFAYGEAMAGTLPHINGQLARHGGNRRYRNLLGITFGTGFGAGVVVDGQLLVGDNSAGGCIWCFNHKKDNRYIAEEGVSIRAVKRIYSRLSGDASELTPYDIFNIAEGKLPGDAEAAKQAFAELGEIAGDAIGQANTVVDGLVVIGGGLAGASKYFMQPLVDELNRQIGTYAGDSFPRSQSRAYNLCDAAQSEAFFTEDFSDSVKIPGSARTIRYDRTRVFGVITSRIGASEAICLGAYAFALGELDKRREQSADSGK